MKHIVAICLFLVLTAVGYFFLIPALFDYNINEYSNKALIDSAVYALIGIITSMYLIPMVMQKS